MKKLFTIFLAVVYLVVSSGIIMEVHHCMGKLAGASVSFFAKETHECGTCGMINGENNCCKDELKLVKLQDSHKQVSFDMPLMAPSILPVSFNVPADYLVLPADNLHGFSNHSPPLISSSSICILNCVFRI